MKKLFALLSALILSLTLLSGCGADERGVQDAEDRRFALDCLTYILFPS